MKFGIGQKVRVKYFKELADKYGVTDKGIAIGTYFFEREMKIYCGEEFYVTDFIDGLYVLDTEDNQDWVFAPETLELPTKKTEVKEDKVLEEESKSILIENEQKQVTKRPYVKRIDK